MPRFSVIAEVTLDIVVDAESQEEAAAKAKAYADEYIKSCDAIELSEPAECDPDYESETGNRIFFE